MMQMVWDMVRAAMQPIALRDLRGVLPSSVRRFARSNGRAPGERQRERLRLALGPAP